MTATARPSRTRHRDPVHPLSNRAQWLAWWDGKLRSLLFDLVVAANVARFGVDLDGVTTLDVLVMVAVGCCFLLRRRLPWIAMAGAVAHASVSVVAVAGTVGLYSMVRRHGPGVQTWGAVAAMIGLQIYNTHQMPERAGLLEFIVVPLLPTATALALGMWRYQRAQLVETLRDRAEQAERERDLLAERAVTAERRRIAREMHDVVAHRVSVISLQAGALTVSAPDERTADVSETIRTTSATALTELREMLRVLRDDTTTESPESELTNTPAVTGIRTLIGQGRAAGANVAMEAPESPPEVSDEVSRAAYRIVQEALTNAAKHAPYAPVRVRIGTSGTDLVLDVVNARSYSSTGETVPGSGYGLIGMRERVTLAGGYLQCGTTADGGYGVRAVFPESVRAPD